MSVCNLTVSLDGRQQMGAELPAGRLVDVDLSLAEDGEWTTARDSGGIMAEADSFATDSDSVTRDAGRMSTHIAAIVHYESGKRIRGMLVLTELLVALAALDIAFFLSLKQPGVDLDRYFESLPQAMQEAFSGDDL